MSYRGRIAVAVGASILAIFAIGWLRYVAAPPVTLAVLDSASISPEVTVLRAQLDAMQRHQEQLVAMISAAFQIVVVVALALAAFSWFSTERNADRESKALQVEMERHTMLIRTDVEQLVAMAERRLVDAQKAAATQQAEVTASAAKKAAEGALDPIRERLQEVWEANLDYGYERSMAEGRADSWTTSAFHAFKKALDLANRHPWGATMGYVGRALDELEKLVRERNFRPDGDQLSELETVLKKVKPAAAPAVDRLRRAIRDKDASA